MSSLYDFQFAQLIIPYPFPIRLFHAGDDEVLPSSPTETSPHHCFSILRDTSVPVGNGGFGYAVLSHKAGNRAPVLNVRANNFSSGFV